MKYHIGKVDFHKPCSEKVTEDQASCKTYNQTAQDPVYDECPGLKVKIADLGNSCWEVKI